MKSILVLGLAFKLTFGFNVGGQAADTYSTGFCVGRGFEEANPLLRPLQDHTYALGLAKGAIGSGSAWAAYELHRRGRRKTAILVNLVSGAAGLYFAQRNFSTCT